MRFLICSGVACVGVVLSEKAVLVFFLSLDELQMDPLPAVAQAPLASLSSMSSFSPLCAVEIYSFAF